MSPHPAPSVITSDKRKAAPDIWELVWYYHLGLDVLLLNINNFTQHQDQTRPVYGRDGLWQKLDHFIIMSKHRQNTNIVQVTAVTK